MTDLRALLAALAVPRRTGSPANARVRDVLKSELAARGFVVMEHRFAARTRWPLWGGPRAPAEGVNLIAVRPQRSRVTTWLVAHHDSKGQPVSMAMRMALGGAAALALPAGVIALALGFGVVALLPAAALAALFLALNRVTDGSAGAVDNAAALLAVLATVDALPPTAPVGVMFPDAEELGLQGARALARERANLLAGTAVINLDGLDDPGATRVVTHRDPEFGRAVARALRARPVRTMPVVVDGMALARAVRSCATVVRGDWGTARRIHTGRDTADRLTLEGALGVARTLAAFLATR